MRGLALIACAFVALDPSDFKYAFEGIGRDCLQSVTPAKSPAHENHEWGSCVRTDAQGNVASCEDATERAQCLGSSAAAGRAPRAQWNEDLSCKAVAATPPNPAR